MHPRSMPGGALNAPRSRGVRACTGLLAGPPVGPPPDGPARPCRSLARRCAPGAQRRSIHAGARALHARGMDATFFGPAASLSRSEDLLRDYRAWLEARNGPGFAAREARMRACFEASDVHESLPIDAARVNRNYARFRERDVTGEELALLAFAKINAGEAWGVEQVARGARARAPERGASGGSRRRSSRSSWARSTSTRASSSARRATSMVPTAHGSP
jgi:hypothetical protein